MEVRRSGAGCYRAAGIVRMDEALAKVTFETVSTEDIAVLQLRHASLLKRAEDLQTKMDRLEADQYDQARYASR